jgi:hypothetical protein
MLSLSMDRSNNALGTMEECEEGFASVPRGIAGMQWPRKLLL